MRRPELDGLRGLAILLVIYHHYVGKVAQTVPGSLAAYALVPGRLSWSGVDLFFVLSGYLIGGILIDNRESATYFKTFYLRRACRILPLYALVVALMYLGDGNGWLFAGRAPWYVYATFTQNFWMAASGAFGAIWIAATWSLAVEEQFYFSLPALVRFVSPQSLPRVALACAAAAPLVRYLCCLYAPNPTFACYMMLPCRMDALMLGVLAAWAARNRACVPRGWLYAACLLFGAGVLALSWKAHVMETAAGQTFGYTLVALFYLSVLLVATSGGFRVFKQRWLTGVGVLAYGLYLFHQPVSGLINGGEPPLADWRSAGLMLLALTAVFVLAKLSWMYFEKPLVKLGHRFGYEPVERSRLLPDHRPISPVVPN